MALTGFRKGFVRLPECGVDITQVAVRQSISRIDPLPQFVDLARLIQVAGDTQMVVRFDVKLFPLADALTQRVCLLCTLRG